MGGIDLILEAEAAGLTVRLDGERVVIRGPRSAEPLARKLLDHKPAVVAVLRGAPSTPGAMPQGTASPSGSDGKASPFADWVLRPDVSGRLGWEPPGLPEDERWWARSTWEDLPRLPEPCPKCGPLGLWWGLLGGAHCLRCEKAAFERGQWFAERAARARERIRETASPGPRPCVPSAPADV